jgi:hypothetical protein
MIAPILLFGLGALIDVVWTLSVRAIQEHHAPAAAGYQALFTLIAVGSTWFVVEHRDVVGLVAYAAGGGLGTWWAVTRSRR